MPAIRVSPSPSPSASSAAGAPVVRKTTFAQYCARGATKPRKAGAAAAEESNTTTASVSRSPPSSSAAKAPVNRKITFADCLACGTIKPRVPGSAGSKESTNSTTTTAAAPPSPTPSLSLSLSLSLSPASSPPVSPSPAPSRLAPVDVRTDRSWTTAVLTRDTKLPGNPLVTKDVRVVNPLVRAKPKRKSAATPASPPATRSPSPVGARQSTPSDDEFDYLFNEPPPDKTAVQDAKEARREAALARSANITTGAIARAGNNPMANTRDRLNRIDRSATSKSARNSGKISRARGGARKSKLGNLAGTSGRWVDPETQSEASSAQLEARRQAQQQQQPQTPLEAASAARRAAEMEQYRREVDRLLSEAPRNSGGCVAVLGDSRMSTVSFGNNLRERRPEENPMWTTNMAVMRSQGGLRY